MTTDDQTPTPAEDPAPKTENSSVDDIEIQKPSSVVKRHHKPWKGDGRPAWPHFSWSKIGPYLAALVAAGLALGLVLWRTEKRFAALDQVMRNEIQELQSSITALEEESEADFEQFGADLKDVNEELYKAFNTAYSKQNQQIESLGRRISRLTNRADAAEESLGLLNDFNAAEDAPWKLNGGAIAEIQGQVVELNLFKNAADAPWKINRRQVNGLRVEVQDLNNFRDATEAPWRVNSRELSGLRRDVESLRSFREADDAPWKENARGLGLLKERVDELVQTIKGESGTQ